MSNYLDCRLVELETCYESLFMLFLTEEFVLTCLPKCLKTPTVDWQMVFKNMMLFYCKDNDWKQADIHTKICQIIGINDELEAKLLRIPDNIETSIILFRQISDHVEQRIIMDPVFSTSFNEIYGRIRTCLSSLSVSPSSCTRLKLADILKQKLPYNKELYFEGIFDKSDKLPIHLLFKCPIFAPFFKPRVFTNEDFNFGCKLITEVNKPYKDESSFEEIVLPLIIFKHIAHETLAPAPKTLAVYETSLLKSDTKIYIYGSALAKQRATCVGRRSESREGREPSKGRNSLRTNGQYYLDLDGVPVCVAVEESKLGDGTFVEQLAADIVELSGYFMTTVIDAPLIIWGISQHLLCLFGVTFYKTAKGILRSCVYKLLATPLMMAVAPHNNDRIAEIGLGFDLMREFFDYRFKNPTADVRLSSADKIFPFDLCKVDSSTERAGRTFAITERFGRINGSSAERNDAVSHIVKAECIPDDGSSSFNVHLRVWLESSSDYGYSVEAHDLASQKELAPELFISPKIRGSMHVIAVRSLDTSWMTLQEWCKNDENNPASLKWDDVRMKLRASKILHNDLCGVNIMVERNTRDLRLIDFERAEVLSDSNDARFNEQDEMLNLCASGHY